MDLLARRDNSILGHNISEFDLIFDKRSLTSLSINTALKLQVSLHYAGEL